MPSGVVLPLCQYGCDSGGHCLPPPGGGGGGGSGGSSGGSSSGGAPGLPQGPVAVPTSALTGVPVVSISTGGSGGSSAGGTGGSGDGSGGPTTTPVLNPDGDGGSDGSGVTGPTAGGDTSAALTFKYGDTLLLKLEFDGQASRLVVGVKERGHPDSLPLWVSPINANNYQGSGATGTVTTGGAGVITAVTVTARGSGYFTQPPAVTIADTGGGTGSGAAAHAVLSDAGQVIGVVIDAPGSGYTTPAVTFTPVAAFVSPVYVAGPLIGPRLLAAMRLIDDTPGVTFDAEVRQEVIPSLGVRSSPTFGLRVLRAVLTDLSDPAVDGGGDIPFGEDLI